MSSQPAAVAPRAGRGKGRRPAPGDGGGPVVPWKAVFFLAAAVTIVAVAAWALLGASVLVVRSVRVVGATRLVPRAAVLRAADIPHGAPLIHVDTGAAARRVERIRQVASAQVSRSWPDGVTITVRPRVPVFAVASAGRYALVDKTGVVVERVSSRPSGMPLLTAGQPATAPARLRGSPAVRAAAAVLGELPASLAHRVRAVGAPRPSDVTLHLTRDVTVVWGGTGRSAEKGKELAVLMRQHARFYDVSSPGAAVTRG